MKNDCYFAINKNDEIRDSSTSGGVFYSVAEYVLSKGGVCYAARFDKKFNVVHSSFDKIEDIKPFQGSKYVSSYLGDTYNQIKANLDSDRWVLFVGAPCQVNGLLNFLKKPYDNLVTMDFICHSNAPANIWRNYLDSYFDVESINNICFKDKSNGWKNFQFRIDFKDGTHYIENGRTNLYMAGYLNGTYMLPSCLKCPNKGFDRACDITIGDAWGIDKIFPDLFDNKGASTVIVHTQKGKSLLEEINHQLTLVKIEQDQIEANNKSIVSVAKKGPLYDDFNKYYGKRDFKRLMEFFCSNKKSIKKSLYYKLKKPTR